MTEQTPKHLLDDAINELRRRRRPIMAFYGAVVVSGLVALVPLALWTGACVRLFRKAAGVA